MASNAVGKAKEVSLANGGAKVKKAQFEERIISQETSTVQEESPEECEDHIEESYDAVGILTSISEGKDMNDLQPPCRNRRF